MTSHVLLSEEILPWSPTLVLSCDKFQNSEAQSIAKTVDKPSIEDVEVASRGVRGANTLTVGVPDLEMANNAPEVDHIAESAKTEKERQRKGKGKGNMFMSRSKVDKKRSSDTESDDVATYVVKRRKEGENERVKSKELQKAAKKSPVKKGKVKKGTTVKSSRTKGPGPSVPVAAKEMTRE
ncbi:hypothetical protein H5410_031518 [Solanum commersonii]|uniref:Uncharacterized protein n=1 Tax=Solanum commersonii TaxID=4109 RepID=A0A9J5YLZ0_SOLCO|nr:hypothetical protein H5410_031518 [Solanum commersonii]